MEFEVACRLCNRAAELEDNPLFVQFFNRKVYGVFRIYGKTNDFAKLKELRYVPVEHKFPRGVIPKEKRSLICVPEEMQKKMLQHYLSRGILSKYFPDDVVKRAEAGHIPDGYSFHWIVPPYMGGKMDTRNIFLAQNHAAFGLKRMIWFPLEESLEKTMKTGKFKYMNIRFYEFPKVFHFDDLEKFCASNADYQKRFMKKLNTIEKSAKIEIQDEGKCLVLKATEHPFMSSPVLRIQLRNPIPNGRDDFLADVRLKKKVRKRDASLLACLGKDERMEMSCTGESPARFHFEFHHIVPLEFGGKNCLENICMVTHDVHIRFNETVEKPLRQFLDRNPAMKKETYNGKEVFIEIPIPMTSYQSANVDLTQVKKVKKTHTKYERRNLRRKEKTSLSLALKYGDLDIVYTRQ